MSRLKARAAPAYRTRGVEAPPDWVDQCQSLRMIRAIALAARLDFTIEPTLLHAIRTHRQEIAKSSLPRLLEEYYKILRAGSSEKAFRGLARQPNRELAVQVAAAAKVTSLCMRRTFLALDFMTVLPSETS